MPLTFTCPHSLSRQVALHQTCAPTSHETSGGQTLGLSIAGWVGLLGGVWLGGVSGWVGRLGGVWLGGVTG